LLHCGFVAKPFPLKKVMGKHNKQKVAHKIHKTSKSFCDEPKSSPGLEILYTSKSIPQNVINYLSPNFTKAQTYFSSLEKIFTNLTPGKSEGFLLNTAEWIQDISGFIDPYRFQGMVGPLDSTTLRPVNLFMKRAHILNPISYMSGEYVLPDDGALPSYLSAWQHTLAKINDPNNEAYVDSLFAVCASHLVEQKLSPHWVRCYGNFCGRLDRHTFNLSEDYEDIKHEPWFAENLAAGLFELRIIDEMGEASSFKPQDYERRPRKSIVSDTSVNFDDVASCEDLDADADLDMDADTDDKGKQNSVEEDENDDGGDAIELLETDEAPIPVTVPRLNLRQVIASLEESTSDNDADDEGDEESHAYSESSGGPPIIAIFKNFPVMATVLECCDGTMDTLLDEEDEDLEETKEQRWTAWLFQVIAALAVAQKEYHFVHNDLHTNNIMWSWTSEPTLYYELKDALGGSRVYAVPTFGRIFKIIDFNRAAFHLGKRGGFFISDAFEEEGDAAGQYNCPPYYNEKHTRVDPNPSFDLVRLACSLMDSLFEDSPAETKPARIMTEEPGLKVMETKSPLYNLLWMWLQQKDGYNVLKNPNGTERFPGFDLYKIIGQNCVNAIPCEQITKPIFDSKFRINKKDLPSEAFLWPLPCSL
jgi:hypothetical protein